MHALLHQNPKTYFFKKKNPLDLNLFIFAGGNKNIGNKFLKLRPLKQYYKAEHDLNI